MPPRLASAAQRRGLPAALSTLSSPAALAYKNIRLAVDAVVAALQGSRLLPVDIAPTNRCLPKLLAIALQFSLSPVARSPDVIPPWRRLSTAVWHAQRNYADYAFAIADNLCEVVALTPAVPFYRHSGIPLPLGVELLHRYSCGAHQVSDTLVGADRGASIYCGGSVRECSGRRGELPAGSNMSNLLPFLAASPRLNGVAYSFNTVSNSPVPEPLALGRSDFIHAKPTELSGMTDILACRRGRVDKLRGRSSFVPAHHFDLPESGNALPLLRPRKHYPTDKSPTANACLQTAYRSPKRALCSLQSGGLQPIQSVASTVLRAVQHRPLAAPRRSPTPALRPLPAPCRPPVFHLRPAPPHHATGTSPARTPSQCPHTRPSPSARRTAPHSGRRNARGTAAARLPLFLLSSPLPAP
ncbi:hypothetical protein PsYK624_070000 [Phanerochaete sordida]|uniref:Uncharacterized protein n=1 Tax=Phanerochaete sordida TaxID=48140 RepID=A0A9P3G9U1_9APHY|nr:hypothetical protein PsYK624_070000 [Phanerochaete sordida]